MLQQSGKVNGVDSIEDSNWNPPMEEIENTITGAGLILGAPTNQLLQAIQILSAGNNFYTYSGTPDVIVLTAVGTPITGYTAGLVVEFFVPVGTTNTGPVTINVDGQGLQNVQSMPGTTVNLSGGEIRGYMRLVYDGSNFITEEPKAPLGSGSISKGLLNDDSTLTNIINLLTTDVLEFGGNGIQTIIRGSGADQVRTVDNTTTLNISGAEVKDGNDTYKPVGYNDMGGGDFAANLTLDRTNVSTYREYTGAGGHTVTVTADANVKTGSTWIIGNNGTSTVDIAVTGGTLRWFDGAAVQTGTRTLAIGGMVTVFKHATNEYRITGGGIS